MKRGPAGLLLYPFPSRAENKDKFLLPRALAHGAGAVPPRRTQKRPGTTRSGPGMLRVVSGQVRLAGHGLALHGTAFMLAGQGAQEAHDEGAVLLGHVQAGAVDAHDAHGFVQSGHGAVVQVGMG